jgi:hypothetical protein
MGNGMLIVSNVEMNWPDRLLDIHHEKNNAYILGRIVVIEVNTI